MNLLIKYHFLVVWLVTLVLTLNPTTIRAQTEDTNQATSQAADQTSIGSESLETQPPLSNQLEDHPSPYLALHGNDPVEWQDWGPDVLERAKRENKLILLSSGYFSCNWCHVMQRESFKDEAVSEVLNSYFIPVKIDRELEPALDKRLMEYAQSTLKRGGWPLNVFVSPDGLPVYATLYQPQIQFLGLLTRLTGVWEKQSERIRELALAEKTPLRFPDSEPVISASLASELRAIAVQGIMARADDIQGGFGESNKFPSVPQLSFLLNSLNSSRDPEVIEFLDLTLTAMAENGMRDQLRGGFYRYVVDPAWEIPHFEKMLYDNANLAQLYLKAGRILDNDQYTDIARSTLDFMISDMADNNGVLYASFSSVDIEDVEGGYYLWDRKQLESALNDEEYRVFSKAWQTERPYDLEEGNHLRSALPLEDLAIGLDMSQEDARRILESARLKLIAVRSTHHLPTDDKLLAGWNALSLSAFAIAARTLDDPDYHKEAEKIKSFLIDSLWNDKNLTRSLAKGQRVGSASIEDYAYVARALFDWAELSGEQHDYQQAEAVLEQGWTRFYQFNVWSYADSSILPPANGEEIFSEDSSASPSATMIETTIAFYNAGKLDDATLYTKALSALNRGEKLLRSNPFWYSSQIGAMQLVKQ
jgi:uncharacterized protein YyaL (SSP411 family)